ncbi:MAG: prephenate dehydrogenase [Clostridiales bacterium]|jgi:prephenate dehydrogenase|nr:prephenate dehydrogenase [Clostridiales bacterium]
MSLQKISILGLGLIGGSLAKAIRRNLPGSIVIGFDTNNEYLDTAFREGIIQEAAAKLQEAVEHADIIFLCTPVGTIPQLIKAIAEDIRKGTIVTDVGSTKTAIVNAAERYLPHGIFFVGGHPMAGTEHSGYKASIPHLFENAYYVLTPLASTPAWVLDNLKALLSSIGAIPLVMEPRLHDRIVGCISHLPHVVAAALINAIQKVDDPQHFKERLAAGGFRDITRIASSNPLMWRDISLSNGEQLVELIDHMIDNLSEFRNYINDNDRHGVENFFSRAKAFRDSLPTLQSLALAPYHHLYVDVEDRPGIIGKIASLLGQHSINIKNLRIIHSREEEPGGCLVISFSDVPSLDKARKVLAAQGFRTYAK